jgi:hypothetical protein
MIAPTDAALYQEILKAFTNNLVPLVTAILALVTAKVLLDKAREERRAAQEREEAEKKTLFVV